MRLTFALAALGIAAFALAAVSFGTGAQAKTVEVEARKLLLLRRKQDRPGL